MKNKKDFCFGILAGIALVLALNLFLPKLTHKLGYFDLGLIGTSKSDALDTVKVSRIISLLEDRYVDDVEPDVLEDGIYNGLVDSLGDRYTSYLNKEEYKSHTEDINNEFVGIGIYISISEESGELTIITPMDDSPAKKAGILPKDVIRKVNGTAVSGANYEEAIAMMRGEAGKLIKLEIYRPSEDKTINIEVKTAVVHKKAVDYEMMDNNIGYIKISEFTDKVSNEFEEAYNALEKQGQKQMVIDLRNNPGGLLSEVEKIADFLLPEGVIVYTVNKKGERKEVLSDENHIKTPFVVLVNENSASASEVLAGAIKDYGVAKIVGETTFGKGLVQGIHDLKDGTALKITIQRYYTPKGNTIQDIGLKPDIEIIMSEEEKVNLLRGEIEFSEDKQLLKAIEVLGE